MYNGHMCKEENHKNNRNNLRVSNAKAYIPLQCETTRIGGLHWAIPPRQDFSVADTNMLVSKNPCGPNGTPRCEPIMPNAKLQCQHKPQREPVEYGSSCCIGHVHFHVVCVNFICVG